MAYATSGNYGAPRYRFGKFKRLTLARQDKIGVRLVEMWPQVLLAFEETVAADEEANAVLLKAQ